MDNQGGVETNAKGTNAKEKNAKRTIPSWDSYKHSVRLTLREGKGKRRNV